MIDYDPKIRGANIDFITLPELELVIVTGLDLLPFYTKLENEILRRTTAHILSNNENDSSSERKARLGTVQISGNLILQIFEESQARIGTKQYDPEIDFPLMFESRNLKFNKELILTALLIYKHGYMNIQEIANVMDLFKKFTMKALQSDGSMVKVRGQPQNNFDIEENDLLLTVSDNSTLDKLLK